jgi:outer membrane immunogenic protein
MIRKLLLGGVAASGLLAAALPASAADLAVAPAPAPVVVAPVFTWSGWYIGGNVGGKWGHAHGDLVAAPVPGFAATAGGAFVPFGLDNNGFFAQDGHNGTWVGGGQLGFNWQFGNLVFGLEGDGQVTDIKRSFVLGAAPPPAGTFGGIFIPGDAFRVKNDWQASLRARGGVTFGRFLLYATGGVAWAGVQMDAFYSPGFVGAVAVPGAAFSESKTLTGGTVGLGGEFAVTNNVSFGVEYRYSSFGRETFNLGAIPFPAGAGSTVVSNFDLRTHEVTARLNFKFGSLFGIVP